MNTQEFKVGDVIIHSNYGTGEIIGITPNGYCIYWDIWSIPNSIINGKYLNLNN